MLNGTPGQRKALLKELIVEVSVESRDSKDWLCALVIKSWEVSIESREGVIPTFRLPATSVCITEAWWAAADSNHLPPRQIGPQRCLTEGGRSSKPAEVWCALR